MCLALSITTYQNQFSASKKREVSAANNAGLLEVEVGDDTVVSCTTKKSKKRTS